jgi:hypothetical protein
VWVLTGSKLEVSVDLRQLFYLDLVLQTPQTLLRLRQLAHHLHCLLQEVVGLCARLLRDLPAASVRVGSLQTHYGYYL